VGNKKKDNSRNENIKGKKGRKEKEKMKKEGKS